MKYVFIKETGRVVEKIDLDEETKWIHIKYARGNFHKTAYIIKHDSKAAQEAIEKFLRDCNASEEIIADIKNPMKKDTKKSVETNFQEFINFMVRTSSVHIMGAIALGLSIFLGYQLGARMDERLNNYPSFTVIGLMFGLVVGCLIGYVMMYKYLGIISKKEIAKVRADKRKTSPDKTEWPAIDVSLYDVERAVRNFSADLPKRIQRTILIKEDNAIDFKQLAPYLKGIPTKPFYMSKETYEIFEEKDKHIPIIIDMVQRAVYLFYKANGQYPMMPYDSLHRVNYYQLIQDHYLQEKPNIELYLTEYNGLITHKKPQKKRVGGF